jgi:hypothetical protein
MIMHKCDNYVRKCMWQLCRYDRVDISLTVHSRTILKIASQRAIVLKKIKCTHMKCHTNVNSTPPTQLPHQFSYTVAILIHNHFETPNSLLSQISTGQQCFSC